jgi:RNA-directed DNA polymerase
VSRRSAALYERYDFEASPWRQDLTQRDFATLIGKRKEQLEALINHKDHWVHRKAQLIGSKMRDLAVPVGKLRTVHERLKFHLNKIKQPDYLMSPRKGRSQRDNAAAHIGQDQFLKLDVKQFYPSTSKEHIFRWAHHVAGLRSDVAGLFTHLATIDGKLPFGSPISPVLATHVHRRMFDEIYAACKIRGLRMSLWVDDLTISGKFVPGELVVEIREIIRKNGLKTHKIEYRTGGRPVPITGVPIMGDEIGSPRGIHDRIHEGYSKLKGSKSDAEASTHISYLLSQLGSHRYHVGASTEKGRKSADRMNALRQRRSRLKPVHVTMPTIVHVANSGSSPADSSLPFDL